MKLSFQITFAGGGNIANSSIAVIGHNHPKWKINIMTRRPEIFNKEIVGHTVKSRWESKGKMIGKINRVSNKASDVIPGSHIIMICSPAQTKTQILEEIKDYIEDGCLIGSIFDRAFDWQAQHVLGGTDEILRRNITLFSL